MSDWTSNEAKEFLSIIRGEAEKVVKDFGDRQSSIYACLAVVTDVSEAGAISVRLLSSPDDGSQDFVVPNQSGSSIQVGDSVWLHYWGDYTNAYIGIKNGDNSSPSANQGKTLKDLIDSTVSSNLLINGGFDVWQRGTSQTASGYASDDRWTNYHNVSTKTHSQQAFVVGQTDVPNNPKYYSRTIVTSGGTASSRVSKEQYVEDVTRLAGKTVTCSFYAKADANRFVSFEAAQYFGSGGSATITGIGAVKIPITSAWARYTVTFNLPSISGKTIGASSCTPISIFFDAGSDYNTRTASLGNQSGTFDIANVQLNYGAIALPFVPRSFADELRLCQRYYETSYSYGVVAGTATYDGIWIESIPARANSYICVSMNVDKRTNPTMKAYDHLGAVDRITVAYTGGTTFYSIYGTTKIIALTTNNIASDTFVEFHWTADAEL